MAATPSRGVHLAARMLAVALAYAVCADIGLRFTYASPWIALLWLPSGIALGAVVRWGPAMAIAVGVAATGVGVLHGASWPMALWLAAGNALGPLLGASLLKRLGFDARFMRRRDLRLFLVWGVIGSMLVTSVNGTLALASHGALGERSAMLSWLHWFATDALGALIAAVPILCLWPASGHGFSAQREPSLVATRDPVSRRRRVEIASVIVATAALGVALFAVDWLPMLVAMPAMFVLFLPVTWLTLRAGLAAGACASALLVVLANLAALLGHGPLQQWAATDAMWTLWAFSAVLMLSSLLVGVLTGEQRAAQARWRLAFEQSNDGLVLARPDGSIRQINAAGRKLLGYAPDQSPRHRDDVVDVGDPRLQALVAQRARGEPVASRLRLRRADGSVFEAMITVSMFVDTDGSTVTYATFRDDSALAQREAELRESEERLRLTLQAGRMGTWRFRPGSDNGECDPRSRQLLGVGMDVPTSRNTFLGTVHPQDRERITKAFAAMVAGVADLDVEFRVNDPVGPPRWVACKGRSMQDAADHRDVVGVTFDITDRHERDAAILAADFAVQASQAKSEFLSRMSHELRTPLNAVLGFAQLLTLDGQRPLDAVQRGHAEQILVSGERLLAMINDMLDLSMIESGRMRLHPQPVLMAPVLRDALALVAPQAAAGNIRVAPPALAQETQLTVRADPARLRQALVNVLSNAIKYNRAGGHVTVTASVAGDQVLVQVEDNGPGMTAAQCSRLFEPFDQMDHDQAVAPGTGIGLSVTRRLMEAMGGSVTVDSRQGFGTRLTLRLLRVAETQPA